MPGYHQDYQKGLQRFAGYRLSSASYKWYGINQIELRHSLKRKYVIIVIYSFSQDGNLISFSLDTHFSYIANNQLNRSMIMHILYTLLISFHLIYFGIYHSETWKFFEIKTVNLFVRWQMLQKQFFWTTKKDICANPDQEQHVTLFVKNICKRMNEYNLNPTEYPY